MVGGSGDRRRLLFDRAFQTTRSRMVGVPTVEAAVSAYQQLAPTADSLRTVPGSPCTSCLEVPVQVSVVEAAAIALAAQELSAEQLARVQERSEQYRRAARQNQAATCPFFDGGCLIHEARPFQCRGTGAPELCFAMSEGSAAGSNPRNEVRTFDLGLISERLIAPIRVGDPLLNVTATRPPPPPNEAEAEQPATIYAPEVLRFHELHSAGDTDSAIKALATLSTTARLMLSLRVPVAYSSEDELLSWRERFEGALTELESAQIDPREAYALLAQHVTYELAYQGLPVRPLLERYGRWVLDKVATPLAPDLTAPIAKPRRPGKPRVGYLSAHLRMNNASKWALEWLKAHGDQAETYAIHVGRDQDPVSQEWMRFAEHYLFLPSSPLSSARLIRELDLDVLIFTDIGMDGKSTQYACLRLARTQCTAWGHPVTSGLPTLDYYLSSDWMEPENAQEHYTEKLVRLPNIGLILMPSAPISAPREPSKEPVLMAQNPSKWTPKWDFLLREITGRLGKPVLMVGYGVPGAAAKTAQRLAEQKIPVQLLPKLSPAQFSEVLGAAAVSIDPPPWSGGNTTIEALCRGIPVVTFPESMMRARHSLAFLRKANAPGLIAESAEKYVELVCNPEERAERFNQLQAERLFEDDGVADALNSFIESQVR